jgi:hypothetical protein
MILAAISFETELRNQESRMLLQQDHAKLSVEETADFGSVSSMKLTLFFTIGVAFIDLLHKL